MTPFSYMSFKDFDRIWILYYTTSSGKALIITGLPQLWERRYTKTGTNGRVYKDLDVRIDMTVKSGSATELYRYM